LQNEYPALPEILPVHRLDMATSGLMVIAKNLDVYKILQSLFLRRKVSKEYTALLSGHPKDDQGVVSLPLRVDLNHRPHQMVCYEHGKSATTEFKVIERHASKTRILFKPITGRTHQLRVHSAHPAGLNSPILGDDLYGTPSDRLYLHASSLRFEHPITTEILTFNSKPDF
jgi:tRNA pseudouridine32 synthase/23S rRNA pseudouridine746 synthase